MTGIGRRPLASLDWALRQFPAHLAGRVSFSSLLKYSEVQKLLKEATDERFPGFRGHRALGGNIFHRQPANELTERVVFQSVLNYAPAFPASACFAISHHLIEHHRLLISGGRPDLLKQAFTITVPSPKLSGWFTIKQQSEIADFAERVRTAADAALALQQPLTTTEGVEKELNHLFRSRRPEEISPQELDEHRAHAGLIAAKLCVPETYEELYQRVMATFSHLQYAGQDRIAATHAYLAGLTRQQLFGLQWLKAQLNAKTKIPAAQVADSAPISEGYVVMPVKGFDSDGEPEIRTFVDGHIELMFNFMPPLNGGNNDSDETDWDTFEQVLSQKLGVKVDRDDRELFVIHSPAFDTAAKLKRLLQRHWKKNPL